MYVMMTNVVLTFSSLQEQYCEGACKSDSLLAYFFPLFCVIILTRCSVCFVLWSIQPFYLIPISAMVKVSFSDHVCWQFWFCWQRAHATVHGLQSTVFLVWTYFHICRAKAKGRQNILVESVWFWTWTLHRSPVAYL